MLFRRVVVTKWVVHCYQKCCFWCYFVNLFGYITTIMLHNLADSYHFINNLQVYGPKLRFVPICFGITNILVWFVNALRVLQDYLQMIQGIIWMLWKQIESHGTSCAVIEVRVNNGIRDVDYLNGKKWLVHSLLARHHYFDCRPQP